VSESTALLRPGLLDGVCLLVACPAEPGGPFGDAVLTACTELGARVHTCAPDATDEASVDEAVDAAVDETGGLDLLVVDCAGLYMQGAAEGGDAPRALRTCLDATWNVTRAVVNQAFLPREPSPSTQRIVYLAPASGAGDSAGAARAGLENLSRTLSTEWARHAITVVTIAPGERTAAGEVAALCAYLASPAGAYFSGCLLDLRGP
jgi:NAD(P)-dependent dehydrogenase (short-subunit alcohol dehydrogenase family)